MKRFILALMLTGCVSHAGDHIRNAADAVAYAAALQTCYADAEKSVKEGEDIMDVHKAYEACTKVADDKFGRKP